MAQNYRVVQGRKVDTVSQERSDRMFGGLNYTMESCQDHKDSLEEQVRKPENVPMEERIIDNAGTEQKAYSGIENSCGGAIGTIGVAKTASVAGPKIYVEYRFAEWRCDSDKAEIEAGIEALEQDVGVGAPATDNLQQQSRDMQLDDKETRHGGYGYEPKQVQEEASAADEQKKELMREGTKETVVAPFHESRTLEVHEQHPKGDQPPKSPCIVKKINEMITNNKPQNKASTNNMANVVEACRPQHEATTNIAGGEAGHEDEQHPSEPSKKGMPKKFKEKLSPSS